MGPIIRFASTVNPLLNQKINPSGLLIDIPSYLILHQFYKVAKATPSSTQHQAPGYEPFCVIAKLVELNVTIVHPIPYHPSLLAQ